MEAEKDVVDFWEGLNSLVRQTARCHASMMDSIHRDERGDALEGGYEMQTCLISLSEHIGRYRPNRASTELPLKPWEVPPAD